MKLEKRTITDFSGLMDRSFFIKEMIGDEELGHPYIENKDLIPLLKQKEPQLICHNDISTKGDFYNPNKERFSSLDEYRVLSVDIKYPGIVAKLPNLCSEKKYLIVDGTHRTSKIRKELKKDSSWYYVLSEKEFYENLKRLSPKEFVEYKTQYDKEQEEYQQQLDKYLNNIEKF